MLGVMWENVHGGTSKVPWIVKGGLDRCPRDGESGGQQVRYCEVGPAVVLGEWVGRYVLDVTLHVVVICK